MTYTLQVTEEQLVIIDRALQEMPFRVAAPVVHDLNRQIAEQQAKQNAEPS